MFRGGIAGAVPPLPSLSKLVEIMNQPSERLLHVAATSFEAARSVAILPTEHRSRRLHGHSFFAKVRAELPEGWAPFVGAEAEALAAQLRRCVVALDYQHLNELLPLPTDENLARYIRSRIDVPGPLSVGLQCTPDSGVDLDGNDHAHVWRRFQFQSAHYLPNVHAGHKCGRMHGHGFEVVIHAEQDANGRDISVDYDALDRLWAPLQAMLDQRLLNDIEGLHNPTSEMIARWIWRQLKLKLPALSWVTVYETASCGAQFDGANFRIWKEMSVDSATRLSNAPATDARRMIHGHTYTLRAHLSAPLDEVLGWTIDYGDVKEIFAPLLKRLDHHPLHELPGITDGGTHSIARFIRNECQHLLPALDRLDVYERRGVGSILCWSKLGPSLPV